MGSRSDLPKNPADGPVQDIQARIKNGGLLRIDRLYRQPDIGEAADESMLTGQDPSPHR
jgi:hypothetical protein